MSGGGSTNTPDMLRLSPSRGPVPPMDWIGRANAGSGLDLRPTGPRKLTRLAWPRDAAVATGAIARPPPRLNYVEESFRVLGRPFSGCPGNGVHRVALGSPRASVSSPVPKLERVEFPAFDLPTVTRAKLHIQRRSLANDVLVPGWSFRYHII